MAAREPLRTCIGCRKVRSKSGLLRVVKTDSGETLFDASGKRPGRGAYVCPGTECLRTAIQRKTLDRALRTSLTPEITARLLAETASECGTKSE